MSVVADDEWSVVAGGGFGIEGAAHRSTLAQGGHTVAVLSGGVDRAYPSAHHELLERIGDVGLLLSEVPAGAAPSRGKVHANIIVTDGALYRMREARAKGWPATKRR